MNNKIMDTLEILEEKIESIKWLVTASFSLKRIGTSSTLAIIRKTAGMLGKGLPQGTAFENNVRGNWRANFTKRRS